MNRLTLAFPAVIIILIILIFNFSTQVIFHFIDFDFWSPEKLPESDLNFLIVFFIPSLFVVSLIMTFIWLKHKNTDEYKNYITAVKELWKRKSLIRKKTWAAKKAWKRNKRNAKT